VRLLKLPQAYKEDAFVYLSVRDELGSTGGHREGDPKILCLVFPDHQMLW